MTQASLHTTYHYQPGLRGRITAATLAGTVGLLILLMLISMGALEPNHRDSGTWLTSISISPTAPQTTQPVRSVRRTPTPQPRSQAPEHRPTPAPTVAPPQMIKLTTGEFAASDISKMSHAPANAGSSTAAYGPGEGPGGARLYNAEWYREPTNSELAGYMPAQNVSGGWAMIACRTVERYHVEDCHELGESRPGSGLSRAMRQAAWQFLVRPPRIDGKPIIGAWVRIRFDFIAPENREPASDASG